MSINYQTALMNILANPAPVLFIDTCIFLDVIRAPIRESIKTNTATHAKALLQMKNAGAIWLLTSETVQGEWRDNVNAVTEEIEKEILKLEQKRIHFLSAANATTGNQYIHGQSLRALNLGQDLKTLSESLLNACSVVTPETNHTLQAMSRVKLNLPPAKRGKSEPKDCEIFETFLHFCRDLRADSFNEKLVYVSSNTNEYNESNSGGIQPELNSYSAKYVSDLSWAFSVMNVTI